jgi:hypothetical protein
MGKPRCQYCKTPIDLALFLFPETENNPGARRNPDEILNKDPRLQNKSFLGNKGDHTLGVPTSYAETFEQFEHSALRAPLFGLTNDPAIPEKVRAIFDIAANLVLYSWFVRDFAAVSILVGYVALDAALQDASKKKKPFSKRIEELDQEAFTEAIKRESIFQFFGGVDSAGLQDRLIAARLEDWQKQVENAAQERNALAHGDKKLLSEATCDQAGYRLQFIGEMINRVCGNGLLKQA